MLRTGNIYTCKMKERIKRSKQMGGVYEEIDIVIVGGGICGLATALALHKKGIKSVILERSEALRATGGGISIQANGWRALDQLGVASKLRWFSNLIQGVWKIWFNKGKQQETRVSFSKIGEARSIKRSDLLEALGEHLPLGTIRFGCQILYVKLDTLTSLPILELRDGSSIRAKVLIGCDGANSVVADFLQLKPKKFYSSCAVRGYTNFPNGHELPAELVGIRRGKTLSGTVPVTDKLVFWFVVHQRRPMGTQLDSMVLKEPEFIRQMTLETMEGLFPNEKIEMVKNCDLNSLSFTHLSYRAPWDILLGNCRKGTMTVAGDAMHLMGPFTGQGGSAAMEDAIVLARCLASKMKSNDELLVEKIGEAIDEYVKERKRRLVRLSTQSYLIGSRLDASSIIVKFIIAIFLATIFRNRFGHARYDCGRL